ncbi:MAG: hypothetical protein FJ104_10865 [Deltaproteobacteria bacterium]|nr:hypothetical protein [Deltaproteobacteria bacterium]
MPRCYFLTLCSGSSVDQQTNNVSLFNLVEQINVPPGAPPPPSNLVPLELHAYFEFGQMEIGRDFDVRFVMVASTGLETSSDVFSHRSATPRLRTRTFGLPFPPVTGNYDLCVDTRYRGEETFRRDALRWPVAIVEAGVRPQAVH